MKKVLLFAAAAIFAANVSAQAIEKVQFPKRYNVESVAPGTFKALEVSKAKKAPRKDAESGVLYNRPAGTYYLNWTKEGRGYYMTFLMVPPLTDISFENVSTAEGDPVWSVNGNEYDAEENGDFLFGSLPVQDPYDANDGVSYYYMPTLAYGENTFTLGAGLKHNNYNTYGSGLVVDTLSYFTASDCHNIGYYGWGFMTSATPYLYGTGEYQGNPCVGMVEDFEKPAAPLFIQDAFLPCLSNLEAPIPEGKELTLLFVELDEEGNEGEEIGRMTATTESLFEWEQDMEDDKFTNGKGYSGNILFESKTTDIFGQITTAPVIINTPYRVYLLGVDQEGVDIGFMCRFITDGTNVDDTYLIFDYGEDGYKQYRYTNPFVMQMAFTAMYDVAVLQDSDEGIYTAPVEGGTVTRANDAEYDAAYVYTAYPWFDDLGNENYFTYIEYADGDEEWLTDELDTQYWNHTNEGSSSYYAVNIIGLEAQPLPEGVAGRSATVYVYGPAAECSFVVNQGDVSDGIVAKQLNEASKKAPVYNLAGLRVGNVPLRGVYIKDGRKILR